MNRREILAAMAPRSRRLDSIRYARIQNAARALCGDAAVRLYHQDDPDYNANLRDLLRDLMHFCVREDLNFFDAVRAAEQKYELEARSAVRSSQTLS